MRRHTGQRSWTRRKGEKFERCPVCMQLALKKRQNGKLVSWRSIRFADGKRRQICPNCMVKICAEIHNA